LTKTLAKEAAFMLERAGKLTGDSIGLTVNTVTPGFIATEMLDHVPEKVPDRIKGQVPVRRLGRPEEVARVVHFACVGPGVPDHPVRRRTDGAPIDRGGRA
jgi:NAD(P)-dependent dehydrogenase (short-subunit alcohol dehydrogenase family)